MTCPKCKCYIPYNTDKCTYCSTDLRQWKEENAIGNQNSDRVSGYYGDRYTETVTQIPTEVFPTQSYNDIYTENVSAIPYYTYPTYDNGNSEAALYYGNLYLNKTKKFYIVADRNVLLGLVVIMNLIMIVLMLILLLIVI